MDELARQPAEDRRAIFERTASTLGWNPAIIEKDFWVCWMLRRLFVDPLVPGLVFKGGTSLSKCWEAIRRFSEDIDLTIPRSATGPFASFASGASADPLAEVSNTARRKRRAALQDALERWCVGPALHDIRARVDAALGTQDGEWQLSSDPVDHTVLRFDYPRSLAVASPAAIKPAVVLEFGVKMPTDPNATRQIRPYCHTAGAYDMGDPITKVLALSAARTFWEKVTFIHAVNSRGRLSDNAARSRHLADVVVLWHGSTGQSALNEHALLTRVANEKAVLYRDPGANYESAALGQLQLVPRASVREALERDYDRTAELYGDSRPDFQLILETLGEIERKVGEAFD